MTFFLPSHLRQLTYNEFYLLPRNWKMGTFKVCLVPLEVMGIGGIADEIDIGGAFRDVSKVIECFLLCPWKQIMQ